MHLRATVKIIVEAFDKSMVKDIDYVLIRHSYSKGTRIIPHIHENADEFVIVSKGHFKIESEGEEKEFKLDGDQIQYHLF